MQEKIKIETPIGAFRVSFYDPMGKRAGREDRAMQLVVEPDNDDRAWTINGVTRTGTAYVEQWSRDGELFLNMQHVNSWDDKRLKFAAFSDAARRKAAAAILPAARRVLDDPLPRRAAMIETLRRDLTDAESACREAAARRDEIAAQLAALCREAGE